MLLSLPSTGLQRPTDIVSLFIDNWPRIYLSEAIHYIGTALVIITILTMLGERARIRRIQKRKHSPTERRREQWQSLRALAIFALSGVVTVGVIESGIGPTQSGLPNIWVALIEFAVLAIAHDTYFYWMHRALHHRALFRWAHFAHHLSRTPTVWAAYSFALGEAVFEAIFLPSAVLMLPVHRFTILIFLLHQIIRNALGHSGYELAWPGFTRSRWTGWLTTTTHHDLHHSSGRWNFGLYFTWWDRWMGSEHPRYHEHFETAARSWFAPASHPSARSTEIDEGADRASANIASDAANLREGMN